MTSPTEKQITSLTLGELSEFTVVPGTKEGTLWREPQTNPKYDLSLGFHSFCDLTHLSILSFT